MFYVYGLIDPRDNQIHYVGITRNTPARRLASHIAGGSSLKERWISTVLDAGFLPTIVVLQTAETYQEIFEMETWWIKFAESVAWPLSNTNKTNRRIVRDVQREDTSDKGDAVNNVPALPPVSRPIVIVVDPATKTRLPRAKRRGRRFVTSTGS